ncbi:short-chain dehydrogenase [Ktedonobacteria bacterium brp13]|nr:short-chain dehydrogenase [Ktedonobacteria bacterium brp13]
MKLELAEKQALVIGSGDEISEAIVFALLEQGVVVAATYEYQNEFTTSLTTRLEQANNGSFAVQVKASDEQAVADLAARIQQEFGHLDIVVNNAAIISHATIQELTLATWQQTLNTNLTSVYLVTQAVLGLMQQGGSIINVSACLAAVGMRGKSHYTAAKAGVIGLSRSLCKELGTKGIRVNVVAPGVIQTRDMGDLSPEQRGRYAYLAALGRLGKPEEVATAILFLASDLSSFVTGATLPIDGGVGGIAAF